MSNPVSHYRGSTQGQDDELSSLPHSAVDHGRVSPAAPATEVGAGQTPLVYIGNANARAGKSSPR